LKSMGFETNGRRLKQEGLDGICGLQVAGAAWSLYEPASQGYYVLGKIASGQR
jgi:hypothetical protein